MDLTPETRKDYRPGLDLRSNGAKHENSCSCRVGEVERSETQPTVLEAKPLRLGTLRILVSFPVSLRAQRPEDPDAAATQ